MLAIFHYNKDSKAKHKKEKRITKHKQQPEHPKNANIRDYLKDL